MWGHTLRTTYATAKGAHGFCGQKWEAQWQPSVVARNQSQQLCSRFSRSQGLSFHSPCCLLPEPSHCCSIPLDATYFGISWQKPQLYFQMSTLFPSSPPPYSLDNSGLEAKRKRCLRCRSLHETPNTSHDTSSFLVSPSQGQCQIQSELWLTWVTSKCRQWQASLEQQVYCSLLAQTATSAICSTQDGDFQWWSNG